MTAQQNCRSSPFMQLKNNKNGRNYLEILKKSVFHVKCRGFIVLQPEERTCCEVLWDDSRYVCLSDSSGVNRGVAFLFLFFFMCFRPWHLTGISEAWYNIGAGDILGDSYHQLQSLLLGCICPISVDIFSPNTVNKNWRLKPVALMFWPPFILFICLFTMFEKWLVNRHL